MKKFDRIIIDNKPPIVKGSGWVDTSDNTLKVFEKDNWKTVLKGGGTGTVDTEMSDESENPVQNKVIKAYVDDADVLEKNTTTTSGVLRKNLAGTTSIATATGENATSFGGTASGKKSFSENNGSAIGDGSHAEGTAIAQGTNSHAEGTITEATNYSEHAEGIFNKSNNPDSATTWKGNGTHTQSSIGIGSYMSHKNAFEVMQNGDAYFFGLCGYDGTNATSDDSKTIQAAIDGISGLILYTYALEFSNASEVKIQLKSSDSVIDGIDLSGNSHELYVEGVSIPYASGTAKIKEGVYCQHYSSGEGFLIVRLFSDEAGTTALSYTGTLYITKFTYTPIDSSTIVYYPFSKTNVSGNKKDIESLQDEVTELSLLYNHLVPITYAELKALRDASNLVVGRWYRITDYQCTTILEDTQSAGHQFDIIVLAIEKDKLNENAFACLHDGDTYFSGANAKLDAWELKYCIDNDTDRFVWADTTNGKGVIFWMKDEWNNECSYDFKNIQYKKKVSIDEDEGYAKFNKKNGTDTWLYTFTAYDEDNAIFIDSYLAIGRGVDNGCCSLYNNKIKPYCYYPDKGDNSQCYRLNYIIFLNSFSDENSLYFECNSNTFGNNCNDNTFGNSYNHNTFSDFCSSNTFGNNCKYNTFGNAYYSNTFGNNCYSNTFGDNCNYNTFGNDCYCNRFDNECSRNTFGDSCDSNIFSNSCNSNTFGDNCYYNTFGNDCDNNTFGDNCNSNIFWHKCRYNTFGTSSATKSYYRYITLESGILYTYITTSATTSESSYLQNIYINTGVCGTSSSSRKTITLTTVGNKFLTTIGSANDTTINV